MELSYTVDGNIKWYYYFKNSFAASYKAKYTLSLLYDIAIVLLDIYPRTKRLRSQDLYINFVSP